MSARSTISGVSLLQCGLAQSLQASAEWPYCSQKGEHFSVVLCAQFSLKANRVEGDRSRAVIDRLWE